MDRSLKILVVDDDDVDRKASRRLLAKSKLSAEIIEASSGEEALELLLGDSPPDCVLLDYLLPGHNGLQVLEQARLAGSQAAIIVLTGQGDERLAVELLRSGATDYLPKSDLTTELIGHTIRNAVRISEAERTRTQTQLELERTLRQISNILTGISEPFVAADSYGDICFANVPFAELHNVYLQDIHGVAIEEILASEGGPLTGAFETVMRDRKPRHIEWQQERTQRWYDSYIAPNADGVSIYSRDISQRKAALTELAHQASHDPLTGLPNRTSLLHSIDEGINRATRSDTLLGVLFFDLDHFKQINDSYGHHVGDELLISFAQRLRTTVRSNDFVARLSGDEFALVLCEIATTAQIDLVREKLQISLSEPYDLSCGQTTLTASIGASWFPQHGQSADELLRSADKQMYVAKRQSRTRALEPR